MKRYWFGIALGAIAVFMVGLLILNAGRHGAHLVEQTLESADPISIPLAFVPFRLGGREVGTIREIQFVRSSPEVVRGVQLDVKIKDPAALDQLQDCALATSEVANFSRRSTFTCLSPETVTSGDFVAFGKVTIEEAGIVQTLLVPVEQVQEWQGDDHKRKAHAVAAQEVEEALAQIRANSSGVTINIWDALKEAGLRFRADSHGAVLQIADEQSGTNFLLRADSSGVIIDATDGTDSSSLQLKADSSGLLLNVREGAKSSSRSISSH
ncbi:MAG: hypothetical protein HKM89_10820 [Gemmatimonadales bacterium]|nr:hypothetical protein [Gemmatimonadales bacterium]